MDAKTLEFCYTNVKPIELIDLASAMKAVNDEFASFCSKIDSKTEAKLYVAEVRKGSVIIDLVPSVVALLPLADNVNAIWEFAEHLKSMYDFLTGKTENEPKYADRASYGNYRRMVAPTAKDADGARFNIVVKDSPGAVINVSVDSERDRILTSSSKSDAMEEVIGSPTVERFNNVVLAFTQLRKDDSGIGDRGVISSISKKSKKIVSDDKSFKESLVCGEDNAFAFGYIVDVEVDRLEDRIIAYRVVKLHERFRIDEE